MELDILSSTAHWEVHIVHALVSTLGNYSAFIKEPDPQPTPYSWKGKAHEMQFSTEIHPLFPPKDPAPASIDVAHLDTASRSSPN